VGRSVLKEETYQEKMNNVVVPYLTERQSVLWLEREPGSKLYCVRYLADKVRGMVLISHGFTETAEKYQECIWYFLKAGYHVYAIDHCGHGHSYRLTNTLSLVHTDGYSRYVDDLLFVAHLARQEHPTLSLSLYGHSMGGGIAAAAAAREPELFRKLVLSSPMIRPKTWPVPWLVARCIAEVNCLLGNSESYVAGQGPYQGPEHFSDSAATSRARFSYYQAKRQSDEVYQMNAPSYGWLKSAGRLNSYLQRVGWRRIQAPVLLLQAENDAFVSKREQRRFARKLELKGKVRLIEVPGTKHEIYNAETRILRCYWEEIFGFLH
jgi:lysophospholipase